MNYTELAGVDQQRIVYSYVISNALVPQLTGQAMALGGIFSGTIITEQVSVTRARLVRCQIELSAKARKVQVQTDSTGAAASGLG